MIAVNVIIANAEGKFLLQMRDNTPGIRSPLLWSFFGGAMEEGEDVLQAAVREIGEELGLVTTTQDFASVGEIESEEQTQAIVRYKHPVEWGAFKVFEGAGAGFFTREEALLLPCSPVAHRKIDLFLV